VARKPRRAAPDTGAEPKATPDLTANPAVKGTPASKGKSAPKGEHSPPGRSAGARGDLSPIKVQAIRQFALDLARKGAGPDTVLICNPISEPSALPAKELLYDRCRWCETDIYYDRLMPSPPDLMRVCLPCGVLLIKAEKKGAN